jgi:hypothetical protein
MSNNQNFNAADEIIVPATLSIRKGGKTLLINNF